MILLAHADIGRQLDTIVVALDASVTFGKVKYTNNTYEWVV